MGARRRVLVADDSPFIRKALCHVFANHPTLEICDEAVNGQEAIEKAEKHRPDLIILDLSMPVLGGLEAAKAICLFLPNVPIILFTMHAEAVRPSDIVDTRILRVVPKEDAITLVRHAEELLRAS
jgi:chemotaxis response regulator CheB